MKGIKENAGHREPADPSGRRNSEEGASLSAPAPEDRRWITIRVLNCIQKGIPTPELLKEVVHLIADWTGFDAVGLRMKEGDDYPYFQTRGMSDEFVRLENSLCPRKHKREGEDDAVPGAALECACGEVLQGRVDRSQPFCTEYGSFWTNCNTRLLEEHPEFRDAIRGECVRAGYETSALVPLRFGEDTFGLIQFEDRRPGMLSEELLAIIESIAANLALALSQRQYAEELRQEKERLEERVQERNWELFDTNQVLMREIEERKKMEASLLESEGRFRLLSETTGRLLASNDPQGIVNDLCRKVMDHLDCQAFFNFLKDEARGMLRLNACAGIPDEEVRKLEWLEYGVAVCGCVARDGERIVAEDILHTPDLRTDLVKSYGIQAYACHPLNAQGKLIGTLSFGTRTRPRFSAGDLALMKTVADHVATAMQRMKLFEELERSRDVLEVRVQERTADLVQTGDRLRSALAGLEQSNRALQDFASIASHDLQEPLRKVLTFGQRLEKKYGEALGEDGRDYLNRMVGAAERMANLLQSLLAYSRVTTRAEPFQRVELSPLVREVLSDLEVRIEKTGGVVHVEELPAVQADPVQMRQLFQNLIGNALKFHREGESPVVRVRSLPSGPGTLCLEVEDNGIGFDEKYLERVFAPFQRLHGRNEYEGTGMGLAICKKIAERHGGSITAKSAPGRGATFVVTLAERPPARE